MNKNKVVSISNTEDVFLSNEEIAIQEQFMAANDLLDATSSFVYEKSRAYMHVLQARGRIYGSGDIQERAYIASHNVSFVPEIEMEKACVGMSLKYLDDFFDNGDDVRAFLRNVRLCPWTFSYIESEILKITDYSPFPTAYEIDNVDDCIEKYKEISKKYIAIKKGVNIEQIGGNLKNE